MNIDPERTEQLPLLERPVSVPLDGAGPLPAGTKRVASPSPAAEKAPPLTLTPKRLADLLVLNDARPIGMTRIRGGWSAQGRFLAHGRAVQLIALGTARIDYSGRHPRLKITRAGRYAIGVIPKEG